MRTTWKFISLKKKVYCSYHSYPPHTHQTHSLFSPSLHFQEQMWAQVAQPNQPNQTIPVGPETQGSSPPLLTQGENASAEPQYTSREQQLLLQLEEARATINIYNTRLRALEEAQAGVPVQERPRNDAEGDTSVDDGRELPPQAVRVNPDIRMVMSDTQGRRVEQLPDSAGGSVMSPPGDVGMLVTNASVAPTAEWSHLNMIRAPTLPAEERCDVLFQQVKNLQESMKEKDQKQREALQMISTVQTQLSASKEEVEAMRTQIGKLQQENGTLKQEVRFLQWVNECSNENNYSSMAHKTSQLLPHPPKSSSIRYTYINTVTSLNYNKRSPPPPPPHTHKHTHIPPSQSNIDDWTPNK